MKNKHYLILAALFVLCVSLCATAFASPDMSRDGRSCYSSECHTFGSVDEELNDILEKLGDSVNDPDPADISFTYEGEPAAGAYTAGEYSADDRGEGKLTVKMVFTENTITSIQIVGKKETPSIGGWAELALAQAIIEAQSSDVDIVAEATITSSAVLRAATNCIAQATGASYEELLATIRALK